MFMQESTEQRKTGGTCFLVFVFAVVVCAVLALLKSLNSVLLSNIRFQHSEASHIGSGCPLHSLKAWEKRLDVLRLKKGVGCF